MVEFIDLKSVDSVNDTLSKIKTSNNKLYSLIMQFLNEGHIINGDILEYFSDTAGEYSDDVEMLNALVNFSDNPNTSVEYISFIEKYMRNRISDIDIGDIIYTFELCIEKNIPLRKIEELFDSGMSLEDILVYVSDEYGQESTDTVMSDEHFEKPAEHNKVEIIEDNGIENDSEDVKIFNNLVSAITYSEKNGNSTESIQKGFMSIIDKFQAATFEMSGYSSEIINQIKKDKEEINRLNATIQVMQQLLQTKQQEINSLKGEVTRLNEKIRTSERADMRRDVLNQKINEVYQLALSSGVGLDDFTVVNN